jgi:hypothetical protein
VVNRTTGLKMNLSDSIVVLLFGLWLTFETSWWYGMFTAMAFLLDALLRHADKKQFYFFTAALAFALALHWILAPEMEYGGTYRPILVGSFAITMAFVPVIVHSRKINSVGDDTGELLSANRVQWAQLMALGMALLFANLYNTEGLQTALPLWSAIVATIIYRLLVVFKIAKN